jgi:hypothetical protein
VVEVHGEDADARDVELLQAGDVREAWALGRRDADDQVQLTGGELCDGDVRLLDAVLDLLDLRVLALPVVLLRGEARARRRDRRGDVVRPGTRGLAGDAEAEVAGLRFGRGQPVEDVLRPDVVDRARQTAEERRVRIRERDLDGVVIDLLDAARDVGGPLDLLAADDVLERRDAELLVGVRVLVGPGDREQHVVRGDRLPVTPDGRGVQVERVCLRIRADVPRLRQVGQDRDLVTVDVDERAEQDVSHQLLVAGTQLDRVDARQEVRDPRDPKQAGPSRGARRCRYRRGRG